MSFMAGTETRGYLVCSSELHRLVKEEAARRGISMQELVDTAIGEWLSPRNVRSELDRQVYRIVTSNDTAAREAIATYVDFVSKRLRS